MRQLFDEIGGKHLRLVRGGAVADGDDIDVIGADPIGKQLFRLLHLVERRHGVDNTGFEHLARRIDDGGFAAVAIARIESQNRFPFDGRLHQQLL